MWWNLGWELRAVWKPPSLLRIRVLFISNGHFFPHSVVSSGVHSQWPGTFVLGWAETHMQAKYSWIWVTSGGGACFDLSLRVFQNHTNMTGVLLLFFVVVLFNCLCLLMIEWWLPEILKLWLDEFFCPQKAQWVELCILLFFFFSLTWFYFEPTSVLAFLLGH